MLLVLVPAVSLRDLDGTSALRAHDTASGSGRYTNTGHGQWTLVHFIREVDDVSSNYQQFELIDKVIYILVVA